MDETRSEKIFWRIVIPLLLIVVGLAIEYWTGIFQSTTDVVIEWFDQSEDSPTPTPVVIEAVENIVVNRASLVSLFDGDLTIAVEYSSKLDNGVTGSISSPGYETTKFRNESVGNKIIYESNRKYEIQITEIEESPPSASFTIVASPSRNYPARTRIPNNFPTETVVPTNTPVVLLESQTVTINPNNLSSPFDGDLTIAVEYISTFYSQATGVISSPGYEAIRFYDEKVGYKVTYDANNKYEIQIISVEDADPDSVTFLIHKLQK